MTEPNEYPEYDPVEEQPGFLYALFIGQPNASIAWAAPYHVPTEDRDRDAPICPASVSATAVQMDAVALRDRRI
jgi:hypothetical protein